MTRFSLIACLLLIALPMAVLSDAADPYAAFGGQVRACWNPVGAAETVAVTVGFALTPEGRVQDNAVTLVSAGPGGAEAVEEAFQAARRAVLRCQGDGYDLPPDQYDLWRDVELTFDARVVPQS